MADGAEADGTKVPHPALIADALEAGLLARFTAHRLFRDIERIEQSGFLAILMQRRFLSLLFPVVYDIAIDALSDTTARTLVREILREEYPDASGGTPSHRENLVSDLVTLGASKQQVLESRPTVVTASVIEGTLARMLDAAEARSDVRVLTTVRFWGEVLVAVEYGVFWRRMQGMFRDAGQASCFYQPHQHHDGQEPLATASPTSQTHSGRLGASLARLLRTQGEVEQLARTEQQALDARIHFYDQFALPAGIGR